MIKLKQIMESFPDDLRTTPSTRIDFNKNIPDIDSSLRKEFVDNTKPIFISYVLIKEYLYFLNWAKNNSPDDIYKKEKENEKVKDLLKENYKKMFPDITLDEHIINNELKIKSVGAKFNRSIGTIQEAKPINILLYMFGPINFPGMESTLDISGATIKSNGVITIALGFDAILYQLNSTKNSDLDNFYFIQHLTPVKNIESELEKNIKIRKNKIISAFDYLVSIFSHESSHVLDYINHTMTMADELNLVNYSLLPTEIKAHINQLIELLKNIKRKTGKLVTRTGFYYLINKYTKIFNKNGIPIQKKLESSIYYRGIKLPSMISWLAALKVLNISVFNNSVKYIFNFLKKNGYLTDD